LVERCEGGWEEQANRAALVTRRGVSQGTETRFDASSLFTVCYAGTTRAVW
jgi:hypothetical protein